MAAGASSRLASRGAGSLSTGTMTGRGWTSEAEPSRAEAGAADVLLTTDVTYSWWSVVEHNMRPMRPAHRHGRPFFLGLPACKWKFGSPELGHTFKARGPTALNICVGVSGCDPKYGPF